jgi:hypothetical protein
MCTLAGLPAAAWAAEPVGETMYTLIYTPAQRADIVRGRSGPMEDLSSGAISQLTGIVRRGNGKSTVWINGAPYQEGEPKTPPIKGLDAVVGGQRLRVGEGVDVFTGARGDVVAPGEVTVKGSK